MTRLIMLGCLLSQFWFLEKPIGDREHTPRAVGPFPSEEMCRIAAKDRHPEDQRFWTAGEKLEAKIRLENQERERDRKREAVIAAFLVTHPGGGIVVIDDVCDGTIHGMPLSGSYHSEFQVDPFGKEITMDQGGHYSGWSSCSTGMYTGPLYEAFTGCMNLK